MKRLLLLLFVLVGIAFAQNTATCPYDGVSAVFTGNYKTIHTQTGDRTTCEYSHAINFQDARQGKHVFWQICQYP